jgi:hypothetical protein
VHVREHPHRRGRADRSLKALPNPSGHKGITIDFPGAILGCGGMVALVYALGEASSRGWSSGLILGLLIGAVASLSAFALVQSKVSHPLLPLRVLTDRNRAGSFLAVAGAAFGMLGMFVHDLPDAGRHALLLAQGRIGLSPLSGHHRDRLHPDRRPSTASRAGPGPDSAGTGSSFRRPAYAGPTGTGQLLYDPLTYLTSRTHSAPAIARATVHGNAVACAWGASVLLATAILAAVLIRRGAPNRRTDASEGS